MEDPIVTIQSATEDWSNLGATSKGIVNGPTLEVPIHLGINDFGMLRMNVKEITEDTILFNGGDYSREHTLRKGNPAICVTYTVGGYSDHDGCDWDGTDYDYWISWK